MYDPCKFPMLGARIFAPVLHTSISAVHTITFKHASLPLHESECLLGPGKLRVGDHAEAGFASFKASQLDLDRDSALLCPLDVRTRQRNVLLVGLNNTLISGTSTKFQCGCTCLCVAGVHHDAVERDALLRKGQRQLEVLRIGRMVEVNGDRDRSLVGSVMGDAMSTSRRQVLQTYAFRQNCSQGPFPYARVTGNIWMIAGLRQRSAARTRPITQCAS